MPDTTPLKSGVSLGWGGWFDVYLFSRHKGTGVQFTDEPTGNLDSATGKEIMELFHGLHRQGSTIVLITHDDSIARQADRSVHILDGKIREVAR